MSRPARATLEAGPRDEGEEPHDAVGRGSDPPEVGAGRIEVRIPPLDGVEQVLDVHPSLELPASAEGEAAHDVRIHQEHACPADPVDPEREAALLERRRLPAGVALEAGVDVEPGPGEIDGAV